MGAVNQAWQGPASVGLGMSNMATGMSTTAQIATRSNKVVYMTVESVDNGFILKSHTGDTQIGGVGTKVCQNMDELRDLFVAALVAYKLEDK